jgi:hypothetical protein
VLAFLLSRTPAAAAQWPTRAAIEKLKKGRGVPLRFLLQPKSFAVCTLLLLLVVVVVAG